MFGTPAVPFVQKLPILVVVESQIRAPAEAEVLKNLTLGFELASTSKVPEVTIIGEVASDVTVSKSLLLPDWSYHITT